jgi:hypothetical protein
VPLLRARAELALLHGPQRAAECDFLKDLERDAARGVQREGAAVPCSWGLRGTIAF